MVKTNSKFKWFPSLCILKNKATTSPIICENLRNLWENSSARF